MASIHKESLEDKPIDPTRPEFLRSGSLFSTYMLRGVLYVLKDVANAVSGYLSFGTSRSTAPTSPTSGTGVYVDYTGVYLTSGGAQELALKPAEIIVGPVAAGKSNIKIASGVIEFRLNTTVMLSIDTSGVITIGEVAADKPNIKIDASDILFRTNTDTNASINAASGTATFNSLTTNILFLTKSSQNFTGGGDKEINVGPTMDASYVLMTTDSNCNLIGISEGFSDGQMIIVLHISGNNVVVVDNSGSVTAGVGPIRTGTGADRTITGRGAMILIWNDSSSWWETISIDT